MSATDPHSLDPAKPHPAENMGHEMSDFSWTSVLWLLPISVVVLVAFTIVCLFWFRGAKSTHLEEAQTLTNFEELKQHRAHDAEILNGYKVLDKENGRVRIPIQRAMELVVQESQGKGSVDWKPITDTYMLGAAFAAKDPEMVETAPSPEATPGKATTAPAGAKPDSKDGKAPVAHPAGSTKAEAKDAKPATEKAPAAPADAKKAH